MSNNPIDEMIRKANGIELALRRILPEAQFLCKEMESLHLQKYMEWEGEVLWKQHVEDQESYYGPTPLEDSGLEHHQKRNMEQIKESSRERQDAQSLLSATKAMRSVCDKMEEGVSSLLEAKDDLKAIDVRLRRLFDLQDHVAPDD